MISEELPALVSRIEAALTRVESAIAKKPTAWQGDLHADRALIERHDKLRATTVEAIEALNSLISQAKAGA